MKTLRSHLLLKKRKSRFDNKINVIFDSWTDWTLKQANQVSTVMNTYPESLEKIKFSNKNVNSTP